MSKVLDEILKLSISERMEIVETIWDSIAEEKPKMDLSEEQKQLLDERLAEYTVSPDKVLNLDQMKAKFKNEL